MSADDRQNGGRYWFWRSWASLVTRTRSAINSSGMIRVRSLRTDCCVIPHSSALLHHGLCRGLRAERRAPIYRPLWLLSLGLDYQVWGRTRSASIYQHRAAYRGGVVVVRAVASPGIQHAWSLLAAALFVAHPVHTEAVTYMTSRGISLSVAAMLAVCAQPRVHPGCAARAAVAGRAGGGGVVVKEIAVTFVGAMLAVRLLIDRSDRAQRRRWCGRSRCQWRHSEYT